ncbi:16S rRNA (adenine(1518)-N(6)/adenine(1519)-N(6))-dimethyltransferase RsmA [Patescibacteria group bacterium]
MIWLIELNYNIMDLLQETKNMCLKYDIKPLRSRGQNFLIKEIVHERIVKFAELESHDYVLEVGPGLGFLTEMLAKNCKKVIAVEIDDKLSKILADRLDKQGISNVDIVNEDILKPIADEEVPIIKKFNQDSYKVVANLPYNITSIFFRRILQARYKPESMVIMVQKEVAERIIADPPKMSLLAVSVQFYANPKIVAQVDKESFWPKPRVDSAVLKLEIKNKFDPERLNKHETGQINEGKFFEMVKIGFSAKRKMLKNNLAKGLKLSTKETEEKLIKAGFNKKIRAQELSIDDWVRLFTIINK